MRRNLEALITFLLEQLTRMRKAGDHVPAIIAACPEDDSEAALIIPLFDQAIGKDVRDAVYMRVLNIILLSTLTMSRLDKESYERAIRNLITRKSMRHMDLALARIVLRKTTRSYAIILAHDTIFDQKMEAFNIVIRTRDDKKIMIVQPYVCFSGSIILGQRSDFVETGTSGRLFDILNDYDFNCEGMTEEDYLRTVRQ